MKHHDFRSAASKALGDKQLTAATQMTADLLFARRSEAVSAYPEFEALRDWGRSRKLEVSGRLDFYLQTFAANAEKAGASVHIARDGREAAQMVTRIALERGVVSAVKSKSMTTEEIGLNEVLSEAGIEVTETDLGELIIQLAEEKPSHILAPAIHKSRAEVADLFERALGAPPNLDVQGLVLCARNALRRRFLNAGMGITGGNFAIADTGSIVLVTNEGNGRMTTTLPAAHVAVVGIDKLIPKLEDLPGFLTLLTRSASGQTVSSYVSMITGPRKPGEEEGPKELHLVLLDNGRSKLANGPFREMLHCLHCGSCLNVCPVYRTVGGHAYGSAYPGPMGDVISPLLLGMTAYSDLPDACTLCGRCSEVCPVRIPLPDFHRKLRALRGQKNSSAAEAMAAATALPATYRIGVTLLRKLLENPTGFFSRKILEDHLAGWTSCRELPRPDDGQDMSFRSWWNKRKKVSP